MKLDDTTNQIFIIAYNEAKLQFHSVVTPEHILAALLFFGAGKKLITDSGGDIDGITKDLQEFFNTSVPKGAGVEPTETAEITEMFEAGAKKALQEGKTVVKIEDLLSAFYELPDSNSVKILTKNGVDKQVVLGCGATDAEDDEWIYNFKIGGVNDSALPFPTPSKIEGADSDALVGRGDIAAEIERVLLRGIKNNIVLVGGEYCDRTAAVESVAAKIASGSAAEALKNHIIFNASMSHAFSDAARPADFRLAAKKILDAVSGVHGSVAYIDDIRTVFDVCGAGCASEILSEYIAEKGLKVIAAATYGEYSELFEGNELLSGRFQKIEVKEPSEADAVKMLEGMKAAYEKLHNVKYTQKALELAVSLSARYINDKTLPSKAVEIIDEAGVLSQTNADGEKASSIGVKEIERAVSIITGIPEDKIAFSEKARLSALPREVKKVVFGQDSAIDAVSGAIKRHRFGLCADGKAVPSILFTGGAGVGKTEAAKAIADTLNMELMRFTAGELYGARGLSYVAEKIRKSPYSVLLIEHVEEADESLLGILYQIIDSGYFMENGGRRIRFENGIVIMTSAASSVNRGLAERLDETAEFNPLDSESACKIAVREIKASIKKAKARGMNVSVKKEVFELAARKGAELGRGARGILRFVDTEINNALADILLLSKNGADISVKIAADSGDLIIQHTEKGGKV